VGATGVSRRPRAAALIVFQRLLGHSDLRITSVHLQGIDSGEIT
jgi:hypothetical protein